MWLIFLTEPTRHSNHRTRGNNCVVLFLPCSATLARRVKRTQGHQQAFAIRVAARSHRSLFGGRAGYTPCFPMPAINAIWRRPLQETFRTGSRNPKASILERNSGPGLFTYRGQQGQRTLILRSRSPHSFHRSLTNPLGMGCVAGRLVTGATMEDRHSSPSWNPHGPFGTRTPTAEDGRAASLTSTARWAPLGCRPLQEARIFSSGSRVMA